MARKWTPQQKADFGAKMKLLREEKKAVVPTVEEPVLEESIAPLEEVIADTQSSKITLNFRKPIEVFINGKAFIGEKIEVDDMATASEIVRIAKEAYGWEIMI